MQNEEQKGRELTFGEKAVGLTFNPSNNPDVDEVKRLCAAVIDKINDLRNNTESGEAKAQLTIAQRSIQEGQMWAVKGATWQY